MRKTGKCRTDRIVAWTAVFVVHVVVGWALIELPVPLDRKMASDPALDLVWIAAPRVAQLPARDRAPAHAARPIETRRALSAAHAASPDEPLPAAAPPANEASSSTPTESMSAVFIRQAAARAAQGDASDKGFHADPFANRTARLPGREARTFRMRPPPSLAERVARVGTLFGGGDDPCRSMRDSINELSQAGDSRVLRDALDYEKRYCR